MFPFTMSSFHTVADYWKARALHAEAKVDELMIEYCPSEMTEDQWDIYEESQREVSDAERLLITNSLCRAQGVPELTSFCNRGCITKCLSPGTCEMFK